MGEADTVYVVPQGVLDESRDFLYERGLEGCEGTGLWIGRPVGTEVAIERFFAPGQRCIKMADGVGVDLTTRAHYTLTDNLRAGELFYARIHSHPGRAYHSQRDDANAILTHRGALSIVVPDFAAEPIELSRCAVYRLEHGRGWLHLSADDVDRTFRVIP